MLLVGEKEVKISCFLMPVIEELAESYPDDQKGLFFTLEKYELF
jgi:hypothetical protein